jgi:transposase
MAEFLSLGHSAKQAAEKFNLSAGRITQLRQRWCKEWLCFQGDAVSV